MISQNLVQKQQFRISPQQIQLLNLFQLNSLELDIRINNELEENPFLDNKEQEKNDEDSLQNTSAEMQDYHDWDEFSNDDNFSEDKMAVQSYINKEGIYEKALEYSSNFKEDAKQQLRLLKLSEETEEIAGYIIDMLNDNGLLDLLPEAIAEEISFKKQCWIETDHVVTALLIVQTLEPLGIGSTNIKECLLKQLKAIRSNSFEAMTALRFIECHYDELVNCQFEKIYNSLKINEDELKVTLRFIRKLKFYPVNEKYNSCDPKQTIIPDLVISQNRDTLQVYLNSSRADSLFVNRSLYKQLAASVNSRDKSSKQYIKNKLQSAEWFLSAVKLRENTMLRIMESIIEIQKDYFVDEDIMQLKPMTLQNISERTGFDLSTISRITSSRYAETNFGIIHLKALFSEGVSCVDGKLVSNKAIQSVMKETIANEDRYKPYSDHRLMNILSGKGYKIARRTVTKYREHLNIPIAQVRAIVVC